MIAFPLADNVSRDVQAAAWIIRVAGRDVTREISPMVLSAEYTDHLHGQSDEVSITVENSAARWTSSWYPTKGDVLELFIGYARASLMPCGQFEIDEIETSGPPDVLTMRCIAAGIKQAIRTKRSAAYEGQTLREIAAGIARRHHYELVGEIDDVRIGRATQNKATDLAFLTALAQRHGHVFSVRGNRMVFAQLAAIEQARAVITIPRTSVGSYVWRDKTHQIYRACTVAYDDPTTRQQIKETVSASGVVSSDVLNITGARVESRADALRQARAALHAANRGEGNGELEISGLTRAVAGNTITASGFGVFDGPYTIETSTHTLSRDRGYRTRIAVAHV